ncbi:TonB-dependent receptor domain-containing protein [Parashewanella tropica]|uniref:TonB-dependent receptor domain-containing protein n=1 Tax=Parashewanella tropica TaxID=2547970 RepID=UPI001FE6EB8D|nr:TonB-dependent receptor [Parashewanella tropica]
MIAPEPLAPLVFFGKPAPYSSKNYYNHKFGPKSPDGKSYDIADWRRRMLETGGRANSRDYKTFRSAVGFKGALDNGWDWEVSYSWGQSDAVERAEGYFNLAKVKDAVGPTGWLDASNKLIVDADGKPVVDAAGEKLVCLDGENKVIAGCVPLNIFGQPGTKDEITPEMLRYISGDYNTTEIGQTKQEVVNAIVTGDLFELPSGAVGFAAGWEYRKESGFYTPDSLILQGITTAGSAVGTKGGYNVDSLFAEAIVPIAVDESWAKLLDLELAVRHSKYSSFGRNTSGKVGIKYKPIDSVMVRATASQAFRAPSIAELFGGAATGFPEARDPCDQDSYKTLADYEKVKAGPNWKNCIASGVPTDGYKSGDVEQIPTKGGGSENWNGAVSLKPETADILTVGVVYSSDVIENFSASVDYWKIELTDAISTVGTQQRLDGCFKNGQYCDSINRFGPGSPVVGLIKNVNNYTVNVGGITTSGVDFDVRYLYETSAGDFRLGLDGTYLLSYDKELSDGTVIDHVGRFEADHDGMFAKVKANFNLGWTKDEFGVNLITRYISGVEETEKGWWTDPFKRDVSSNIVFDFQGNWDVSENVSVTLGVDNVFDREPPFVYSAFGANTDVSTYDVIGRFVYLRAGVKF